MTTDATRVDIYRERQEDLRGGFMALGEQESRIAAEAVDDDNMEKFAIETELIYKSGRAELQRKWWMMTVSNRTAPSADGSTQDTTTAVMFQGLIKRVANSLKILLEEVKESQHKLLDILHTSTSAHIALPINKALFDPAKPIWQPPITILLTYKRADKKYVPSKDMDFLFSQHYSNSLDVDTVNEHGKQHHTKLTPYDKDWKRLDLFGRKLYSSVILQFRITNYQDVMAKCNHINYYKLNAFIKHS
ncbi:hypothetical protein UY3_11599 [Chelonia mydas]|uniref:Uncharacterized protein n=1 Tax=Chelonia mydas TaxID=8469 RepID=M7B2I8_CHEMY|nr:hypothetical protein UY3_11599 [Chelonia mydas]